MLVTLFLVGFLWSTASAKHYLTAVLPYIDKTLSVTAKVKSINTLTQTNWIEQQRYIQFDILQIEGRDSQPDFSIAVFWDQPQQPMAGQIWHLQLKTKVVHNYLNEGGFDSQRFAITNRNLLSAKIIQADLLQESINLKQTIVNNLLPYITAFTYKDLLLALTVGDRSQLTPERKTMMMQTGIAHLIAISGMHIILVFAISLFITKSSLFFLPNRFMHYAIPTVVGWLGAFFYAWLSGMNPPVMRALLALSIWIILRYRHGQITAWQKINRIIAILLVYDPLMILSESFWLSCYAVISLIFLFQWVPLPTAISYQKRWYIVRLLHLQLGLTLLFLPIQLVIFQGISSVSLLANLIAIPMVTIVTFPAVLAALLFSFMDFSYFASGCWWLADKSLAWLFYALSGLNMEWMTFSQNFFGLSLIGWLAIIAWRTNYWRCFLPTTSVIILLLLAPFFKQQNYLWRVDMLDVGHGLAIVIHNGSSAILYDTGAKWENSSAAERVIIPFLKWHGLTVDGIIISHQHNDHIGGLSIIQKYYPQAWLMSTSNQLVNDFACIAGERIKWQHLTFDLLWPERLVPHAGNGDSCVVKISDGQFSILLTGDLERQQEYLLAAKYRQQLFSQFLQIPHHGSNTSSSYAFLGQVKPQISLASTSRYNPWKLPSYKVMSRYATFNLPTYVTAQTGQISLYFTDKNWYLNRMRHEIKPRWYHQWFGALPIYE